MSQQYVEPEFETPPAHRVLKIVAYLLIALGLLEWFVLGANRPEDPLVSPTVGLTIPLVVSGLTR